MSIITGVTLTLSCGISTEEPQGYGHLDCQGFCGQPIADGAPVWRGPMRPRWCVVSDDLVKPLVIRFATGRGRELSVCADCARAHARQARSRTSWGSLPRPCVRGSMITLLIAMGALLVAVLGRALLDPSPLSATQKLEDQTDEECAQMMEDISQSFF